MCTVDVNLPQLFVWTRTRVQAAMKRSSYDLRDMELSDMEKLLCCKLNNLDEFDVTSLEVSLI
jgi:hypothetical protein